MATNELPTPTTPSGNSSLLSPNDVRIDEIGSEMRISNQSPSRSLYPFLTDRPSVSQQHRIKTPPKKTTMFCCCRCTLPILILLLLGSIFLFVLSLVGLIGSGVAQNASIRWANMAIGDWDLRKSNEFEQWLLGHKAQPSDPFISLSVEICHYEPAQNRRRVPTPQQNPPPQNPPAYTDECFTIPGRGTISSKQSFHQFPNFRNVAIRTGVLSSIYYWFAGASAQISSHVNYQERVLSVELDAAILNQQFHPLIASYDSESYPSIEVTLGTANFFGTTNFPIVVETGQMGCYHLLREMCLVVHPTYQENCYYGHENSGIFDRSRVVCVEEGEPEIAFPRFNLTLRSSHDPFIRFMKTTSFASASNTECYWGETGCRIGILNESYATVFAISLFFSAPVFLCVVLTIIGLIGNSVCLCCHKRKSPESYMTDTEDPAVGLVELSSEDGWTTRVAIRKEVFNVPYSALKLEKKVLGTGGSGATVRKAKYRGTAVALKLFPVGGYTQQKDMEDFMKEIRLMEELNFPSIIGYFGATLALPTHIGLIMELCIVCLRKYFPLVQSRGETVPLLTKLRFLLEISQGMGYLHSETVIHRDLKPENVLLDENLACKITDFGLSRAFKDSENCSSKTAAIGTTIYMAPEIIRGENYSNKIDVYSFALLAFVILTENFFPYSNAEFIVFKVSSDPAFRPDITTLEGPEWLKRLVVRNWDHDPEKRSTFDQIAKTIEDQSQRSQKTIYIRSMEETEADAEDFVLEEQKMTCLMKLARSKFPGKRIQQIFEEVPAEGGNGGGKEFRPLFMDSHVEELLEDAMIVVDFSRRSLRQGDFSSLVV